MSNPQRLSGDRNYSDVIVEAHQGGAKEAGEPANSLAAIAATVKHGIRLVEIDVCWIPARRGGGDWLLTHRPHIGQKLEDMDHLPRLSDVLRRFNVHFDLDVKTLEHLDRLPATVRRAGATDQVVVSGMHDLTRNNPLTRFEQGLQRSTTALEAIALLRRFKRGDRSSKIPAHVKVPAHARRAIPRHFAEWLAGDGKSLRVFGVTPNNLDGWLNSGAAVLGTNHPRALQLRLDGLPPLAAVEPLVLPTEGPTGPVLG